MLIAIISLFEIQMFDLQKSYLLLYFIILFLFNLADKCKLPKVAGPCEGYYPQWYYDNTRNLCTQFIYGGCLGNNNRFETKEKCDELCVTDIITGKKNHKKNYI